MKVGSILLLVALLAGLGWWGASLTDAMKESSAMAMAKPLADGVGLQEQRLRAALASLAQDPLDPRQSVFLVVSPQHAYSTSDAQAVHSFVQAGGTLVVADDQGQANSILAPFGMAFERVRLVETTPDWDWQSGIPALQLSSPTALLPGEGANVLARSSDASFLDRDANGLVDGADPLGPFPVVAVQSFGLGKVIAIADADAFQGSALAPNTAWLRRALDDLHPGATLLLVAEPASTHDPAVEGLAWLRSAASGPTRPYLVGALCLAAPGLLFVHAWTPWRQHRFRPLRYRPRRGLQESTAAAPGGLTERGAVAVAAVPILVIGWALTGSIEAALAASLLLVLLGLACLVSVPRLEAERRLSTDRLMEGSNLTVEVTIRSRRRARLELQEAIPLEFRLEEGQAWGLANIGGPVTKVHYVLVPALRGEYSLGPLRARARDLFALRTAESLACLDGKVVVVPRAATTSRTPVSTRKPMLTLGPHRVNRAGDGTEFHALRPYLPGDPFRSVNWKASARSKDLMVNQRVHESMTRLTVFLDARAVADTGPASQTPFARSCRAALSISMGVLRLRDRLRFVVYGDGVQEVASSSASRQAHDLSDLLSRLVPSGSTSLAAALAQTSTSLRPGYPVLVLSSFEGDLEGAEALSRLPARGVLPFVVAPPPLTQPADAEDGDAEPDAQRIASEHESALARLRSGGVPVYSLASEVPLDQIFGVGVAA